MNNPPFWDGVLRRLAAEVPAFVLDAWLRPLTAEPSGGGLRILCSTPFHRERIRDRFLARIRECAEAEAGGPVDVALDLAPGAPAGQRAPAPELAPAKGGPAPAPAASAAPVVQPDACAQGTLLHTFGSFVVGPCNALAREASLAIAEGSQVGLRSLYLVAASGLGKTHLARAVVVEAARRGVRSPLYVGAETFTSEFLAALRGSGMPGFKRRYRAECELLVVDDVPFLGGKTSTQLELFHTLDHLLDAGRRIVLTGDRLPGEIPDLDPRLRSRMTAGLVAEIEPPDARVRRHILRTRAAAGGVRLPEECLDLLVESIRGSVRDLEGVLIQLVATASLLKRAIDLELTAAALRKVLPRNASAARLLPEDVIEVVAAYFKTAPAALASRSRRRDVLLPRQLAMYLSHRYTRESMQRIGHAFDRRHTAVINAVAVVERRMLERAPLRYQVEALSARLDDRAACPAQGPLPSR